MGKKKNKKKSYDSMVLKYYGGSGYHSRNEKDDKDDRKKSKKNKKSSGIPGLKIVHMSLDKKDIRDARKVVTAPVDVPKKFLSIRKKCNHAGDLLTPAQYRTMTLNYAVYTPMLDAVCEKFGEDNVQVCAGCYDVLVNYDAITSEDIRDALTTLYVSANKVVSLKRMKGDEIEDINKLKNELTDWNDVIELMDKIDEAMADAEKPERSTGTRLNDIGNSPVVM